jgi:hypothetical protein
MTVKELIEQLEKIDGDAKVMAYDRDSDRIEEVTGFVYEDEDGVVIGTEVDLMTDETDIRDHY